MRVHTVETPPLGDRSYLVEDGAVGVVVDPQRDLDRMEAVIAEAGVRVTHVVETHLHNDYVSGGPPLAERTGAAYVLAAGDEVSLDHHAVSDGDVLEAGSLRVRVVATPGHTVHHVAYVVEQDGEAPVAFTGGNLLFGSVGRTDLVDPDLTDTLTRQQYHSARRLADLLPDETGLHPTHGFGSFCSSGPATAQDSSTVGEQRRSNDALTTPDEDEFVKHLLAGLTAYPRYYAHMGALNRHGLPAPDLAPPAPVDRDELYRRLDAGEWVVDLRDRTAYARGHLVGSVSFEHAQSFTTYLGWVLPWGEPLTLVGDSAAEVAEARRDLARIGLDHGVLTGSALDPVGADVPASRVASYPRVGWEELRDALASGDRHPVVLDVRREDEYDAGHVEGAVNLPVHDVWRRLDEAPDGQLWVHCGSGYRASIAASILARAGHDVVHVDDMWPRAAEAGVPVTG